LLHEDLPRTFHLEKAAIDQEVENTKNQRLVSIVVKFESSVYNNYSRSMEVQLSKEELAQVIDFAQKIRQKQSKPGSRDHVNDDMTDKRLENEIVGKVGEYAVAKLIGGTIDLRIWESGTRGISQFEPDISDATRPDFVGQAIHVKTCNWKYLNAPQRSWTVDKNDPIIQKPKPTDIIFLAFASANGRSLIHGHVLATRALPYWKPCVSTFMAHKRAIYYNDIKALIRCVV